MKKLIGIIAVLLLVMQVQLFAQTTTDQINYTVDPAGFQLNWTSLAIDSAETIYSQNFRVPGDNISYTTYPFNFGYDFASADSINVGVYWIVSYDNVNWIVADTIVSATSATAAKGTFNLNNVKAPRNKIKVVNNTGSSANTFNLGIYHPVGN